MDETIDATIFEGFGVATKNIKFQMPHLVWQFPEIKDIYPATINVHLNKPFSNLKNVIGEMALAIYEGRLDEADIPDRVREFVNVGYRRDHDQYGPISLDVPIFEGSDIRGIDRVTETIWQQA